MKTRTFWEDGSESLRHNDYVSQFGYDLDSRLVAFYHAVEKINPDSSIDRGDSVGDMVCHAFIPPSDPYTGDRPIGSWFPGAPSVVVSEGKSLPIFDKEYTPDTRYSEYTISLPPGFGEPVEGELGVVYGTTREDGELNHVFIPAGSDRSILAPNLAGAKFSAGTKVFDLSGPKKSDIYFSQVQRVWRVNLPDFSAAGSSVVPGSPESVIGVFGKSGEPLSFLKSTPFLGNTNGIDGRPLFGVGGLPPIVGPDGLIVVPTTETSSGGSGGSSGPGVLVVGVTGTGLTAPEPGSPFVVGITGTGLTAPEPGSPFVVGVTGTGLTAPEPGSPFVVGVGS